MIAARWPWHRAVVEDPAFKAFLDDPSSLYHNMPISRGASEILERVFDMSPMKRMTIPEMRHAIIMLDSFFEDAASLNHGVVDSSAAQQTSQSCHPSLLDEDCDMEDSDTENSVVESGAHHVAVNQQRRAPRY